MVEVGSGVERGGKLSAGEKEILGYAAAWMNAESCR
jgi:hypothetical protein